MIVAPMAMQALGEKAALDGFWLGVTESLYDVSDFARENIYAVIGVFIVFAYFMLRKR